MIKEIGTTQFNKIIPNSLVREAEEISRSNHQDFREVLVELMKLAIKEIPECPGCTKKALNIH